MRQQPLTRMEDASCTIQPEAAAAANKRRQEPFPSHDARGAAPSLGQIGREGGVDSIPSFPTLELCKKSRRKSTRENRAIRRDSLPETVSNLCAKSLKHIFKISSTICTVSQMSNGGTRFTQPFPEEWNQSSTCFLYPASRCCISTSTHECMHAPIAQPIFFTRVVPPPAAAAENRRL